MLLFVYFVGLGNLEVSLYDGEGGGILKRVDVEHHGVEDTAKHPYINFRAHLIALVDIGHLRGPVHECGIFFKYLFVSSSLLLWNQCQVNDFSGRWTKIAELEHLLVEEDVLHLHVTVAERLRVHMHQPSNQVTEDVQDLLIVESSITMAVQ